MPAQQTNCADTRHLIHLAVGDDTQPEEESRLLEHLEGCSDCRAYHAGMVDAMHVLEQVRDDDSVDVPAGAVWAGISQEIRSRRPVSSMPERRRFNGAVAALCACSLTLALVSVVQNLPMNSPDTAATDGWAPMSAVNVGLQNGPTQGPAEHFRTVPVRQPDGTLIYVNPANGQVVAPDFFQAVSDDASLNF